MPTTTGRTHIIDKGTGLSQIADELARGAAATTSGAVRKRRKRSP